MQTSIQSLVVGGIATNCYLYPLMMQASRSASSPSPSPVIDPPDEAPRPASSPQPCVVIDPGDEASRIIARLDALCWRPRAILFTHGHFDHLAALPALLARFSGGDPVEVAIHAADAHYLGRGAYQAHVDSFTAAAGNSAYVDALWHDLPAPTRLLADGDRVESFEVLHVPGHSGGSVAYYDRAAGLLFSGDTLFRAGFGRTDLPGGNENALAASVKRLFALDGSIVIYPGHGAASTLGEEKSAYRWA